MATWSGDRKVWDFLATANSADDEDSRSEESSAVAVSPLEPVEIVDRQYLQLAVMSKLRFIRNSISSRSTNLFKHVLRYFSVFN